jgi:hypothetical protein
VIPIAPGPDTLVAVNLASLYDHIMGALAPVGLVCGISGYTALEVVRRMRARRPEARAVDREQRWARLTSTPETIAAPDYGTSLLTAPMPHVAPDWYFGGAVPTTTTSLRMRPPS